MRVRVLVVDDDAAIRRMLDEMLTLEGYEVLMAEHGGPALLRILNSRRPLVVLLGMMMPYMTGEDVLCAVAANPEVAARHRIVLVTGSVDWANSDPMAALRAQLGVPLVTKPFSLGQILDAVDRAAQELAIV